MAWGGFPRELGMGGLEMSDVFFYLSLMSEDFHQCPLHSVKWQDACTQSLCIPIDLGNTACICKSSAQGMHIKIRIQLGFPCSRMKQAALRVVMESARTILLFMEA